MNAALILAVAEQSNVKAGKAANIGLLFCSTIFITVFVIQPFWLSFIPIVYEPTSHALIDDKVEVTKAGAGVVHVLDGIDILVDNAALVNDIVTHGF